MHRADVDDAAAALAVYVAQRGTGGQEGAVQVHRQLLLPPGELELVHRRHDLDARIAHQDVEAAEGVSKTWGRPLACPRLIDLADA